MSIETAFKEVAEKVKEGTQRFATWLEKHFESDEKKEATITDASTNLTPPVSPTQPVNTAKVDNK